MLRVASAHKTMSVKVLSLFMLCWALLLVGCNRNALVETTEKDGIRLTLKIGKASYRPGETVKATTTLKNTNRFPITYTTAHLGEPPVYVFLETEVEGCCLLTSPDDPAGYAASVSTDTIAPRQSIVREVLWDQTFPGGVSAPPGEYTVRAAFQLGDYYQDREALSILEAERSFTIE